MQAVDEMAISEISNAARLLAFLVNKATLSVSTLKMLNFSALSARAELFLTLSLGNIIIECDERATAFRGVLGNAELMATVQGCLRFIETNILKKTKTAAAQCAVMKTLLLCVQDGSSLIVVASGGC